MPSSISEPAAIAAAIRARAAAIGFDAVRIAPARLAPIHGARLTDFLAAGRHGSMAWLARNADKRADPAVLWPEARSVVMVGVNYGPAPGDGMGPISLYARGGDYHDTVKKMLKRLGGEIAAAYGADVKVFVDTAPVLEKALAETAGIGWQGKHTNLVSRNFGSWLFLGAVFTDLALPADEPARDRCGACHACLDACPTHAFLGPRRMDARRCISYLTIEYKGHIPQDMRAAIGTRIYGCDECLAACPWNKFAKPSAQADFRPRPELSCLTLADFARLDDAGFRTLFRGSPIKRIGRDRFVRNVLIALANAANPAGADEAERLLGDASPLVRAMAVWALARLAPARLETLTARQAVETDPDVLAEWHTLQ